MEDRQREAGGLAGAGLRATEQVAAFQQQWDRLRLDRRWRVIVELAQNAVKGRGQWQRLEGSRGHVLEMPASSRMGGWRCR